jgi:hypothetical protein
MNRPRGTWTTLAMLGGIAAFVTATGASQAPSSQQGSRFGSVYGRVVDHETGAPIRFADVQISRVRSGVENGSAVASEDGTFTFTALQPGSYVLAASSAAYPPSYYSVDPPPLMEPGSPFPVTQGQATGPLVIRLMRGGVITGTITDPSGAPVTGAMLDVHRSPPVVSPGRSPFSFANRLVYSDVNGVYRAFGLAPGKYIVSSRGSYVPVSKDPTTGRPRKQVRVYFPDTADPAAAVPVEVASGQERAGVDLRGRVASLFRVSGTVSVPADAKVDSPFVRFQPMHADGDFDLPSGGGRQWSQSEIPPGHYWITAVATEAYVEGPPPAQGRLWWAAVPLNVTDQDVSDVSLVLQSSTIVAGRIVVDGADKSAASTTRPWIVTLSPILSSPPIIQYPSAVAGQADASGLFAIRNVTPGRYTVRLVAAPSDTAVILGVTSGGREFVNGEVEIAAGSTIEPLTVRVRR